MRSPLWSNLNDFWAIDDPQFCQIFASKSFVCCRRVVTCNGDRLVDGRINFQAKDDCWSPKSFHEMEESCELSTIKKLWTNCFSPKILNFHRMDPSLINHPKKLSPKILSGSPLEGPIYQMAGNFRPSPKYPAENPSAKPGYSLFFSRTSSHTPNMAIQVLAKLYIIFHQPRLGPWNKENSLTITTIWGGFRSCEVAMKFDQQVVWGSTQPDSDSTHLLVQGCPSFVLQHKGLHGVLERWAQSHQLQLRVI